MKPILNWCVAVSLAMFTFEAGETGNGIRSTGLGFVVTVLPGDIWAVVHNAGGLPLVTQPSVSVTLTPALFGMKELRTTAICGNVSLEPVSVSLFLERFGFDLYKEFNCVLGFGALIESGVYAGCALNWRRVSIQGYGRSDAMLVNVGCIVDLVSDMRMGFVANNVLGETIGVQRQRFPQIASVGISYTPLASVLIAVEVEKDPKYASTLKVGFEARTFEHLVLRFGLDRDPDLVTAGFSVNVDMAEFGYAAVVHPQLGTTHQVEVSLRWKE